MASARPATLTNKLFEPCPSGREPTFDERVAYEMLLATGGNETTAQLLSNLVILLLERSPRSSPGCGREPQLRPSAVEEVLRYISPVTGLFRHTTRTSVVGRHREMPAEAKVLLMYGSGNHDERHYERARRVRHRPLPPRLRRCRPPQLHHRHPRLPRCPPRPRC